MNQIIEWIAVSGITISIFAVAFAYTENILDVTTMSQYEKLEYEKNQAAEHIILIEKLLAPLQVDVMNIGLKDIRIKKIYVDGNDANYQIKDRFGNITNNLKANELASIVPSINGVSVKLITENLKVFDFQ